MKVLELSTGAAPSTRDMLAELDTIREDVEAGRIVGFTCAGVRPSDETIVYWASIDSMTRARLIGCLSYALHMIQSGQV